jgi:hypothetical protein
MPLGTAAPLGYGLGDAAHADIDRVTKGSRRRDNQTGARVMNARVVGFALLLVASTVVADDDGLVVGSVEWAPNIPFGEKTEWDKTNYWAAGNRADAESLALKKCSKQTKNAKIVLSFCSNGVEH